MSTDNIDRELLTIAARAIAEYTAWTARNEARTAAKKWRRDGGFERGEEISENTTDDEALAEWRALESAAMRSQRKLSAARAATRRAVVRTRTNLVRAAASLAEKEQPQ
jgi:hypothetical protein